MIIVHNLLKKQKRIKNSAKVKVDSYAYATAKPHPAATLAGSQSNLEQSS
jgi:hypothetical protein